MLDSRSTPTREIVCEAPIAWLATYTAGGAIVTAPPEAAELGVESPEWEEWFGRVIAACFRVADPVVLYLTDQVGEGRTISRAEMALHMARHVAGMPLIWHRIATHDGGAFSHMLAFGRTAKADDGARVMAAGKILHDGEPGLVAARAMVAFAKAWGAPIIDPFCRRGTIPAVAQALGVDSIGIDVDPAKVADASKLRLATR